MSWFGNLTSALSGQSGQSNNGGNNAGNSEGSGGGSSDNSNSTPVRVFDGYGNSVDKNQNPNQNNQNNQGNQGNQNNQDQNKTEPVDIETILFSEPENQNQTQPNNPNQNQNPNNPPEVEIAPGFTQAQLINNIKSVNFANAIPVELVTQALGGDAQAFAQAMNNIAQISAAIAVQQSTAISKSLLDKQKGEWESSFSSKFSDNQFSAITADPKYSNPFIKPMVENIVNQMRKRDSSITPEQVKMALPKLLEHAIKSVNIGNAPSNPQPNNPRPQQNNAVSYDDLF